MARRLATLATCAVALAVLPAEAARAPNANFHDSVNRYQLHVPNGWRRRAVKGKSEQRTLLAGWRGDRGQAIAITRIDGRNPLARRGKKKFFDAMEASLKEDYPKYKRIYRRIHRVRRVRTMDLIFRRGGAKGEVVAMRMLIFSRYAITMVTNTKLRKARRLMRSFAPYFAPKRKS